MINGHSNERGNMINGHGNGIRPEDAAAFIVALNQMQPYVPPIVFNQLASSPIAAMLAEVANRRVGLEVTKQVGPNAPEARDTP